jgi:hypothetical protein
MLVSNLGKGNNVSISRMLRSNHSIKMHTISISHLQWQEFCGTLLRTLKLYNDQESDTKPLEFERRFVGGS